MAKDTRVTFDNSSPNPSKQNGRPGRHSRTERQISYEETENCVNEMSESFPALSNRAHRLMRQVSESFNFRTIKVALIISAILNLALGIPFGVFVGIYISQKSESSSSSSPASTAQLHSSSFQWYPAKQNDYYPHAALFNMEVCVKCSDISEYDVEGKSNPLWRKIKIRSRNDICCTDEQVPELENLKFQRLNLEYTNGRMQDKKNRDRDHRVTFPGSRSTTGRKYPCYDSHVEATAAAHMMLDVKQTKYNTNNHDNPQDNPLAWIFDDDKDAKNFLGDGVSYSHGEIKIVEPGKYHVYSQVTLDTNENPLEDQDSQRIITFAVLITNKIKSKDSKVLLSSQITMKNSEVRSMNTEGTFEFSKGDSVSVYVSYPSLLKDVKEGNSFGLFKL